MDDFKTVFLLALASLVGSLVHLVSSPEGGWRAAAARIFVGISCAVFLGAPATAIISRMFNLDAGPELTAAAGFVIGTAADKVLAFVQSRLGTKEN